MARTTKNMAGVVRRGFSLIELLVVVVILAVLMGFLLPVLGNLREKGRCAKCISNLKQLHAATMAYAMDNNTLPYSCSEEDRFTPTLPTKSHWGWITWYSWNAANWRADQNTYWHSPNGIQCIKDGSLWSYVGDLRVYLCPTVQRMAPLIGTDWGATTRMTPVRSYSMNSAMHGFNWFNIKDASRRMLFADAGIFHNRWYNPATKIGESARAANVNYYTYFSLGGPNGRSGGNYNNGTLYRFNIGRDASMEGTWRTAAPAQYAEGLGAWHDGYAHCVFVDGHVERVWYTNGVSVCGGTYGTIN